MDMREKFLPKLKKLPFPFPPEGFRKPLGWEWNVRFSHKYNAFCLKNIVFCT